MSVRTKIGVVSLFSNEKTRLVQDAAELPLETADELNVIQLRPSRLNLQLKSLAAQEDIHEKAFSEKV